MAINTSRESADHVHGIPHSMTAIRPALWLTISLRHRHTAYAETARACRLAATIPDIAYLAGGYFAHHRTLPATTRELQRE